MFAKWRLRRKLARVGELAASTPDGTLARVRGIVRILETELPSPTTGIPCVAFSIQVQEPSRREPGGFEPNKPFECVELVPFVIECAIGRVIVDSQFGELHLPTHRAARLHDVHWTDFVDKRALSPSSTGIEMRVVDGDTVSVIGTSLRRTTIPGKEASFRESPTQLCLVGDFDHPIIVAA